MSSPNHSPAALAAAYADAIAAVKVYARAAGAHYRGIEELRPAAPGVREAHVAWLAAEAALVLLRSADL